MRRNLAWWRPIGVTLVLLLVGLTVVNVTQRVISPQRWTLWGAESIGIVSVLLAGWVILRSRAELEMARDLQRAEATFHGILTISADAILIIDESERITLFNQGAEAIFGYTGSEMLGQPLGVLIPERFRTAHHGHVATFGQGAQAARRMGERRAIYGLRKDGREFPAEASIARVDVEGARYYSVVLRDISERVRAKEREEFLASASAEVFSSLDYSETIEACCRAGIPNIGDLVVLDLADGAGVRRVVASAHGSPWEEGLAALSGEVRDLPRAPFPTAQAIESGEVILRREIEPSAWRQSLVGAHASTIWHQIPVHSMAVFPLASRERKMGAIAFALTTAGRVWEEEDLAAAGALAERVSVALDNAGLYAHAKRASRARDELLGVVSHDLRNPLSAITLCARVLSEHPPETAEKRRDLANNILEAVAMMQRLIQDLLEVATIESGHLKIYRERCDAVNVARRVLAMVQDQADDRGVIVHADLPDEAPATLDPMRIEQVIVNLLANAIKFTDRGGHVYLTLAPHADALVCSIRDTGIGIPAESLPYIFDRFWHAQRSGRTVGTGLGLAIAKGIIAAHGGLITVTSAVGEGSTFTCTIPNEVRASHEVLMTTGAPGRDATI